MSKATGKRIGIVLKYKIDHANKLAGESIQWLLDRNCDIVIDKEASHLCEKFPQAKHLSKSSIPEATDLILVFGGDGTFLSIARQMRKHSTPILGINMGQLGFLTETPVEKVGLALESILSGEYEIQDRTMLSATVLRDGKTVLTQPALNDAVITNNGIARILDLHLKIDSVPVASIKADGLIFSTPTGSTAYSLAAGGPIIHPCMSALTIVAICPHSLTVRPIVVPDTSHIEVNIGQKGGRFVLTLDGQFGYDLNSEDTLVVTRYMDHPLKIIRMVGHDFFETLREKLKLGARGENKGEDTGGK